MDERVLAERLITYDTSTSDGLRAAVGFIKGWLEAREVPVTGREFGGLPVVLADVGPAEGPCVILHGHVDVVPAHAGQFSPRIEGDRLIGRGAYDMKGGLAAMMCAVHDIAGNGKVRVRFICVPDEESDNLDFRCTEALVEEGLRGDFAITGEPTDLHIGVQAKGVLAIRVEVTGTAAHGSTPWVGDNAILKAYDMFRRIETLRFSRESSDLFDRPSINIARIIGGDAFNKVPDRCTMDIDIRFLPSQDPGEILAEVRALGDDVRIVKTFQRAPARVSRSNLYVRALREAVSNSLDDEAVSVGRDGASDAISFLEAGVPAVEFGPTGGGHHGPEEWVSIDSLTRYRQALRHFVFGLPDWLAQEDGRVPGPPTLRAVDGGLN
ncbi:MAG TPA: M20/M25/M40 family metallo-hydrolase [Solirubrobacteraceae bacterium]|nr:M20/M25/M40 family metallo-hydrolase [Solirubrobacteraceae bacterium]